MHQSHRRGDYPPADHDPSDPETGAEFLQHDVAGNLKQKIPQKEYPGANTVDAVADFGYVYLHLQLGEPYVAAIKVGRDIAQEEQRDNAPGNFGVNCFL